MATRRKKWGARERATTPIEGLPGAFLNPVSTRQIKELDAAIESAGADPTAIIDYLWHHLVVDEEGHPWEYDPADIDLADVGKVRQQIERIASGEAVGTPGE